VTKRASSTFVSGRGVGGSEPAFHIEGSAMERDHPFENEKSQWGIGAELEGNPQARLDKSRKGKREWLLCTRGRCPRKNDSRGKREKKDPRESERSRSSSKGGPRILLSKGQERTRSPEIF